MNDLDISEEQNSSDNLTEELLQQFDAPEEASLAENREAGGRGPRGLQVLDGLLLRPGGIWSGGALREIGLGAGAYGAGR